jgi:hypothetical protein
MQLLLAQFDGLVKGYNDHAPEDKVRTSPPLALRQIGVFARLCAW